MIKFFKKSIQKSDAYLAFYGGKVIYWNGEDEADVEYHYLLVNADNQTIKYKSKPQIEESKSDLQKAISIASNAFLIKKDRANKPYIFHLLYVMGKGQNEKEKIVGVLHDLIEDCGKGYENIILKEFGQEIFDAVKAITKIKGEDYEVYLQRVKSNEIARQVKLYDLEHNMDIGRLSNPEQKDFDRLEKYKKSYQYLQFKKKGNYEQQLLESNI